MYVCVCEAVTARELDAVIASGASDVETVSRRCGAGTRCGGCLPLLEHEVQVRLATRRNVAA